MVNLAIIKCCAMSFQSSQSFYFLTFAQIKFCTLEDFYYFQVYLSNPVDRETLDTYALTIDATDGGGMMSGNLIYYYDRPASCRCRYFEVERNLCNERIQTA